MKSKLYAFVIALTIGLFAMSTSAEAGCRWFPAHWAYGQWIPGHSVCGYGYGYGYRYGYRHCGGFWRNGYWHRRCW